MLVPVTDGLSLAWWSFVATGAGPSRCQLGIWRASNFFRTLAVAPSAVPCFLSGVRWQLAGNDPEKKPDVGLGDS